MVKIQLRNTNAKHVCFELSVPSHRKASDVYTASFDLRHQRTMASQRSSKEYLDDCTVDPEIESLVDHHDYRYPKRHAPTRAWFYSKIHIISLYISNMVFVIVCFGLMFRLTNKPFQDPTIGVYCTYLAEIMKSFIGEKHAWLNCFY